MATGNLLLGQASGAVGSLVFARANGKQLTKARQEQVRYSNTLAQAIQRICISTAGQAYRHMQEVCCKSFQGIQTGKATHDEFIKRNVRMLRQIIRQADAQGLTYSDLRYFTQVGNDTLLANAYIVSSGSLPTITTNIKSDDPTNARLAGVGTTYQDIVSFFGLQRGDILTFVFMQPDTSGIVRARSARVVLDPRSPMGSMVSLDVPIIAADNLVNYPNPGNSGEFTYLVSDSGDIVYSLVNSDVPLIAAGVFASRRTAAGSWLHSDCQLSFYNDSDILDKFTLQQAIDVANGVPIAAISTDYLNNAGTSRLPAHEQLLPDGFSKVQYINSNRVAYIDLGMPVGSEYFWQFDMKWNSYLSVPFFGAFNQGGSYSSLSFVGTYSAQSNRFTFYVNSTFGVLLNINKILNRFRLQWNGNLNKPTIDGHIIDSRDPPYNSFTPSVNAYLFCRNEGGRASSIDDITLYSFKVSREGQELINLVPCIRNSDGVPGCYDTIRRIFLSSATGSPFIPGPFV